MHLIVYLQNSLVTSDDLLFSLLKVSPYLFRTKRLAKIDWYIHGAASFTILNLEHTKWRELSGNLTDNWQASTDSSWTTMI